MQPINTYCKIREDKQFIDKSAQSRLNYTSQSKFQSKKCSPKSTSCGMTCYITDVKLRPARDLAIVKSKMETVAEALKCTTKERSLGHGSAHV